MAVSKKGRSLCPLLLWCIFLLVGFRLAFGFSIAHAQEQVGSYTVVAGDSLSAIAGRFGVTVDDLVALNNIADPALIEVGQVLLIPGAASGETLGEVPTILANALPGETLLALAQRTLQDPAVLSALNNMSDTQRLFPMQPIRLPANGQLNLAELHLGAIQSVTLPDVLIQGRTGHLLVQSSRPLSLTATWNGLPIAFTPLTSAPLTETASSAASALTEFALLPVPALLAPGPYTINLRYTARNGFVLQRDWQVTVAEGPYETQDIVLPDEKGGLLEPTLVEDELAKLTQVWSAVTPQLYWTGVFSLPISSEYATTSPFGTRRSYNSGPVASYHSGQDFGAPEGVTITAPAPGVVALAEPLNVRGNAVLIDHGRGIFTGYWHLSEIKVAVGQQVQTGDVIGLVGTTGLSTGAHLHWELRIYGVGVDPMQFVAEPLIPQ
ncbi:MAG: peptidoglycan DD-metalloendopeptidase family protein [Caldilineaceae bacterium]|nr:peptidoglycan DD-metalloendopeptidase family protein [Caldilineaceae bacterium]